MRLFFFTFLLCFLPYEYAFSQNAASLTALCGYSNHSDNKAVASAEYMPNVDVHGKQLVPVETTPYDHSFLNTPIIIPVEIELIERFGLDLPLGTDLEPIVGLFEIEMDGTTRYNGKDVSDVVQKMCDQHRNNKLNQAEQDGHESDVPVVLKPQQHEEKDRIEGQFPNQVTSSP